MDIFASALILIGSCLHFTASLGLVKFPDFLIRLHAASKSSTFGVGLVLLGFAIIFRSPEIWVKFTIVAIFIFLSTPVVAHLFARVHLLTKDDPDRDL